MTTIRRGIKRKLVNKKVYGRQIFSCFINEDGTEHNEYIVDTCENEIDRADIVLVLYTGDAREPLKNAQLPMVHFELKRAMDTNSEKVKLIKLTQKKKEELTQDDQLFINYVNGLQRFRQSAKDLKSKKEIEDYCCKMVIEKTIQLAKTGKLKGQYVRGVAALDWANLNYESRKSVMVATVQNYYKNKELIDINKNKISILISAISGSFSEPLCLGLFGQPFRFEKESLKNSQTMQKIIGPIHIISCYKTITELQIAKLIGLNELTIIVETFGFFVADNVDNLQCVFLLNCKDEHDIKIHLDRFTHWLINTTEQERIIQRAEKRMNNILRK